jgi:glycosyltransferase involved in cell wall biosynthesis
MANTSAKIKILVDGHIFDQSFQGTATYLRGIYNQMVKHDDLEITICAHDISKVRVHFKDPRFNFIKLERNSKIFRLALELPQIIRKGKFHYAHFQYIVPIIKNCKFIVTVHDLLFLSFKQYFPISYRLKNAILYKMSARRSDIILTVSNYSKGELVKKFNLPENRIHIIGNAVDAKEVSAIDVGDRFGLSKYILYVSRFEPRKNHIGLLRAFINLNLYSEGYELVFVGSKRESIEELAYNELVELILKTHQKGVKFFDNLSFPELNALYQHASCFVYPSLAEGFGIPPLEAAVNHCKVICSNQTAMGEFVFFKYLFDPNVPGELEKQLALALNDNEYDYKYYQTITSDIYNWPGAADKFYHIILNDFNSGAII